jgi:hypothetical protein
MKELTWDKANNYCEYDGKKIRVWSKVRNELNGLRPYSTLRPGKTDVCYSITEDGLKGVAIMPRPYPSGRFIVTGFKEHPDKKNDSYLFPVFMLTDAVNRVEEWELDKDGRYSRRSGRLVLDYFNGWHFSSSDWTQGCVRVEEEEDMRWIWKNVPIGTPIIVT